MRKVVDWMMERLTWVAGVVATLMIVAMLFYLSSETRYAFKREFPFGFRFALNDPAEPMTEEVGFDPYNTFLGSHPDGADGLDEKEETMPMPALSELKGVAKFGTGAALDGKEESAAHGDIYKDDWHAQTQADKKGRFLLVAFATEEYAKPTMRLRWEPDGGFDPALCPFQFKLRLLRAPKGVDAEAVSADLVASPIGYLDVPTFVARTDKERTEGYVFELAAIPTSSSNVAATLAQLNRSE